MQDVPLQEELAKLRAELNELKAQIRELKQCVEVTPADPTTGTARVLKLRCNSLVIETPGPRAVMQALLTASPDGAQLVLGDKGGACRVQISATANPGIEVLDANGEPAAELAAEGNGGKVLVSQGGHPRAVLKCTPEGGCVSVLHDDGRPRASLLSTAHNGADLVMITPDLKPGLRASSGAPHGGLLSVHDSNGSPAVTLLSGASAGGLVVSNRDGSRKMLP